MASTPEKANNSLERNREKLNSKPDSLKKIEKADITNAALDTMATIDAVESTTGRVSETLSKSKDQDGGGGSGATKKQYDPAAIKARLLENAPTTRVMVKQIEKEIKKEIKYLHKKAMRMVNTPGEINYFEMNNLLKKMRELKGILVTILKSSLEGVKTMWLRFVHGIM